MSTLLAYLFASAAIVEGIYIWMLRDLRDQREGYISNLQRELSRLRMTNQTHRARERMSHD